MSVTIVFKPHDNPRIDPLTDAQRLRWVLEFIQRDLEVLTPEELAAVGDDLRHATAPWWVQKKRQCTDISAAQVRALQQEIREGVQAVMGESIEFTEWAMINSGHAQPHGGWVLPNAQTHLLLVRFYHRDHGHVEYVRESTSDQTAILNGVASLICRFGSRLYTCPVCGTMFLRQYRQTYCTVRCSNKVRNRRRLDRQADQQKSQRRRVTRLPDTASLTMA
jgi:hypothetical protein